MVGMVATEMRRAWRDATGPQRVAYAAGTLLMVSGLLHLGVWAVLGGPASGPLSWRKPVTFGFSFGITAITLSWVAGHLRLSRRTETVLLGALTYSTVVEVSWVTMQRWRGVPSHFATAPLDAVLFLALGGGSVAILIAVIVAMTALSFTRMRPEVAPSMATAIRVGLVVLIVAQGVGGTMIGNGFAAQDRAVADLTRWGAAGALKLAHFVPMHAVQALPALALLASFTTWDERRRTAVVRTAAAGYVGLVAVVLLQAFSGMAPWDLSLPIAAAYLAGAGLLAAGFARVVTALLRRPLPA